jgi:hypothetical protein
MGNLLQRTAENLSIFTNALNQITLLPCGTRDAGVHIRMQEQRIDLGLPSRVGPINLSRTFRKKLNLIRDLNSFEVYIVLSIYGHVELAAALRAPHLEPEDRTLLKRLRRPSAKRYVHLIVVWTRFTSVPAGSGSPCYWSIKGYLLVQNTIGSELFVPPSLPLFHFTHDST